MAVSSRMLACALLVAVGLASGCETMSNTTKGAGIGTAIGAGAGTLIGAATGNPKTGAVVGGLIGGGTGALIGNDVDKQEQREAIAQAQATASVNAAAAQAQATRLGMSDVVQMAQEGQSEDVIINQIRATNSTYQLSTGDLSYLKANRVPDRVIVAMQNARPQPVMVSPAQPTVIVREPPPFVVYERPYYGYGRRYWYPPPPPPPPGVGFGVVIRR